MSVCQYVCISVCLYVCMDVCMHVCIYVCVYVCVFCDVYVCMNTCMDVCICRYGCVRPHQDPTSNKKRITSPSTPEQYLPRTVGKGACRHIFSMDTVLLLEQRLVHTRGRYGPDFSSGYCVWASRCVTLALFVLLRACAFAPALRELKSATPGDHTYYANRNLFPGQKLRLLTRGCCFGSA